ncbi:hypothetical protein IKE67_09125 [bacterium]|nr:hypothetical protein [bacterium]
MNIFKKITKKIILVNKIEKAFKKAKTMIDNNQGLAVSVKNRLFYLKTDIEEILQLLPQFKPIYKEVMEIVKEVF